MLLIFQRNTKNCIAPNCHRVLLGVIFIPSLPIVHHSPNVRINRTKYSYSHVPVARTGPRDTSAPSWTTTQSTAPQMLPQYSQLSPYRSYCSNKYKMSLAIGQPPQHIDGQVLCIQLKGRITNKTNSKDIDISCNSTLFRVITADDLNSILHNHFLIYSFVIHSLHITPTERTSSMKEQNHRKPFLQLSK